MLDELEAAADWEVVAAGIEPHSISRLGPRRVDSGKVSVSRGSEYNLDIVLECALSRAEFESLSTGVVGRPVERHVLEATRAGISRLRIQECAFMNYVHSWSADAPQPLTRIGVVAPTVTVEYLGHEPASATVTTDWYLNGPHQFRFARTTVRERHERYVRRRVYRGVEDTPALVRLPLDRSHNEDFSFDYLLLKTASAPTVIVSAVPRHHGPQWSRSIAIEYHHEPGCPPDEEERAALSEALGFLFGRHLLCVGWSRYDKEGYPVMLQARTPWGRDPIRTCMGPSFPPLRHRHEELESLFQCLIDSYIEKRHELDLREVVWMLWMAQRMPVGFDLPLYSAALERLMQAWFKSKKSRSRGVYMPKAEFDTMLAEEFAAARVKLGDRAYADRILRRIAGCFSMGVNERFEVFFGELGLQVGEPELRAIRARNNAAHGGKLSAESTQEQVKLGRAYQTLLNRAVLTVLGHVGSYTDYFSDGHPERPVSQPIPSE